MIVKRLAPDQIGTEIAQRGEEFFRVADAGEGQNAMAGPVDAGLQRMQRALEMRQIQLMAPIVRKPVLHGRQTDRDHRIGALQPGADRLAQGAGRDAEPVAEALGRIDDDQRQVMCQRGVLKTVIQQDQLCAICHGGARALKPAVRDPDRGEGRHQQRLVASLGGAMAAFIDAGRLGDGAAIAAADDLHRHTLRQQPLRQRDDGRGLAGAAGIDIADADHRHVQLLPAAPRQPPRRGTGVKRTERAQQLRGQNRRAAEPEGGGAAAHAGSPWMVSRMAWAMRLATPAPPVETAQALLASSAA